ncbi:hypothetical protein [Rhodococcoides yunnanense]|uniref:hypothetical protein n=1 Tax=Rhodococcoides yunnanense TaxID=278209 RepID=UPI001114B1D6|nr:hypothetical protein [Rhodococcus yunnanensis]
MQFSDHRADELPGFPVPRVQLVLGSMFAGVLVLIALIVAGSSVITGQVASALATGFFAVFITATAAFAWSNQPSRNVGEAVRPSVTASSLRYDSRGLPLLAAVVGSLVVVLIAFGFAAGGAMLMICGVMGAFLATFFVPLITRSIRNGTIELTAEGIRRRGWSYESEVTWDAVVDVSFAARTYAAIAIRVDPATSLTRRNTTPLWRIEKLPTEPLIELDCRRVDIHPMVLARWIRFYNDNPAARIELGTRAAEDRLVAER